MTGKEIKYIIERSGIRTNAFAEKMGISPQSLNSIFLSPDVKSGTIELVAKVLGVPVGELYGDDTKIINHQEVKDIGDNNNINLVFNSLRNRDEQIDRLLTIIEKLQQK